MSMRSSPFGVIAIIALMGIWFYLGAVWKESTYRPVLVEKTVDPRMMHCYRFKDRSRCTIELQMWDSTWQFDYSRL